MKKLAFLFVLSFLVLATYSNAHGEDHPIVGKWEYVKTILPDGSEVFELIATEHFYSDGTLLFVNVWLNPLPVKEFSNTRENIESNLKSTTGGIATYTIEKGKERDRLTYTIVNSTRMNDMGVSHSIDIKVDKDTFIYYPENGAQWILKRVSD
jgi:hypothetical protein